MLATLEFNWVKVFTPLGRCEYLTIVENLNFPTKLTSQNPSFLIYMTIFINSRYYKVLGIDSLFPNLI